MSAESTKLKEMKVSKKTGRALQASENFVTFSFLLSDALMLILSEIVGLTISRGETPLIQAIGSPQFWALVLMGVAIYSFFRLYPGIGISPADELRRLFLATCLLFVFIAGIMNVLGSGWQISNGVYILSWVLAIVFVPLGRAVARFLGSKFDQWGMPVVILSNTESGTEIAKHLIKNRDSGFRPVALLGLAPGARDVSIITGPLELAPTLAKEHRLANAILVFPFFSSVELAEVVDECCSGYQRLFVIPSIVSGVNIWVTPIDVAGNLGLEIKQNLLSPSAQRTKRAFDIVTSLASIIVAAPFMLAISLAIKLDSKGPIIFLQERIGRGGKVFNLFKFRTMTPDAEEVLHAQLDNNETLREQWLRYQKLSADPRITRVGKWLRRWSLDELPQIFNVLRGDMSIVGPRPMTAAQVEPYGGNFQLFSRVRPGLTGLWQVTGRNRLTFYERSLIDGYYVRNWSLWLDAYILAKTPLAVVRGEGPF
jgi:Undecaprenyl-phosphate galactose phosphotransferase WbaP